MQLLLPARRHLLPTLLLALLAWLGALAPARASHLLGGEMSYRYLDANGTAAAPFRYEITVLTYYNPNGQVALNAASVLATDVVIYNRTTGARIGSYSVARTSYSAVVRPHLPSGCTVSGPSQPFQIFKYVLTVALPATVDGYYAVNSQTARNTTLTNVNNANNGTGGGVPMTLYVSMTSPLIYNRSPVFTDTAVAIVCQNDTTIVLNSAVDPDGDRLIYAFGTPYGTVSGTTFPPYPASVPYNAGYSTANPFGTGAGNFAILNASTGIAKYGATQQGQYSIAVDVSEYRTTSSGTEILLGTTRRDLQLVVASCPSTVAPALVPAITVPRSYTVQAGQSLTIPITATQANNHPLLLTASSVLLDGTGGYNATLNGNAGTVGSGALVGTATASGTGTVTANFVYNTACADARSNPYDVSVVVQDQGCAGKTVVDVFRITVVKPSGPTAIAGDAVICTTPSTHSYTASGGTAPSVSWRVTGGTIVGSATANPVQVNWTSTTGGTLVARGLSQYGCLTDSVSRSVTVTPAPALTVTGNLTICQGSSTSIAVSGAGTLYTVTGGPVSGSGSTFVLTPTATTTYTVTSQQLTANGCASTTQITVTVNPTPVANAGSPAAYCSGGSAQLGAAPVTGLIYSWSPATGLSSPTAANPTATLTNTGTDPLVQVYTLTVTNPATGCASTATVAVTVNPAATASAGPAQSVCAGSSITLGTAALPGYTYSWSPATGLSSPTAAQPVLTGINATSAPLIQTYTLTATTAQGCTATSTVVVTINPKPAAEVISGATSVCPTVAGIVYSILTPASPSYQWTVMGGTIASGQGTASITVNWGAAGTGSVSVVASNAQGCQSDATTLPVIINQVLQTTKPSGPLSVCQADGPYTYTTPAVNGSSFAWQLFGSAMGTLTSTGNSTSISFSAPGVAKLVVTQTSNPAGGICRGVSDTLYITVKPSPSTALAIQGPARYCFGSAPQTYALPGTTGSSYVFTFNGAAIANTGGVVTIPATTVAGTYTITARETNSGGCAGPLYTRTFTVDPLPGAFTISGPRFVCPATRTLPYAVANANPASTYQWTVVGGTVASGQGTASITVSFPATLTSNATVSAVETSQFGCNGQVVAVTVVPDNAQAPQLTLASVVATDNTRVTLTFAVPNPATTPNQVQVLRRDAGSTGAYATVGTVAPGATTFTDATAKADQMAYQYSLSLTNGCGDVLPNATPHTTVLLKALAVPGTPAQPRNQGGTNLTWTAYDGFQPANYQVYESDDKGTYSLIGTVSGSTLQYATANKGQGFTQCYRVVAVAADGRQSNSNTACVEFTNGLAFYNIITPNGDNLNDKLEILNVRLYPGNTMQIYNRWGRQVFSTTNYDNDTNYWGTDPGVAPGVYYFLFKQANGSATKGWVEVVK